MGKRNYSKEAQMLMSLAMAMIDQLDELWAVYQKLMEDVDYNNPDQVEALLPVIFEYEHNLVDILDQVQGQLYLCTGVYEPLPTDKVEDFEASVLTTLAGLDKVDLEDYRIEEI